MGSSTQLRTDQTRQKGALFRNFAKPDMKAEHESLKLT